MKAQKLSPSALEEVLKANKTYLEKVGIISRRVNYIINYCVELCEGKVSWWDWPNGNSSSDASGDFMNAYASDSIQISGEWNNSRVMEFITKDGGEWSLVWGEIPTRWLFEDFEEEFKTGLQKLIDKKQQKAAKAKANREAKQKQKDKLTAAAVAKLTKEERKILGLK